jgi:hypothetical protein
VTAPSQDADSPNTQNTVGYFSAVGVVLGGCMNSTLHAQRTYYVMRPIRRQAKSLLVHSIMILYNCSGNSQGTEVASDRRTDGWHIGMAESPLIHAHRPYTDRIFRPLQRIPLSADHSRALTEDFDPKSGGPSTCMADQPATADQYDPRGCL